MLFIRLLIGGLLLVTAAMKILSPAESAAMAVTYRIPPLFTAAVVQAELAIAALLIFGCWTKRTLTASAVMFGLFGAFSIYRGWAGYESCGCFGSFQVNPWITATLDELMFLLAARSAKENLDHLAYLLALCELELVDRERRAAERRLKAARFPASKTLDEFDFAARPSLNKPLVLELVRGDWIDKRENLLLVGPVEAVTHCSQIEFGESSLSPSSIVRCGR